MQVASKMRKIKCCCTNTTRYILECNFLQYILQHRHHDEIFCCAQPRDDRVTVERWESWEKKRVKLKVPPISNKAQIACICSASRKEPSNLPIHEKKHFFLCTFANTHQSRKSYSFWIWSIFSMRAFTLPSCSKKKRNEKINLQLQAQTSINIWKQEWESGMWTGIYGGAVCGELLQSLILPTLKILLHNSDATMEIS